MNLDASSKCKDIHIYDDDEKEEAQMDEEEGDDEPDFMDNSGKCWEFANKIGNEKDLKEWCQNKMGGMIVGKEEKLTRQFHCQIKQCQFKAIFLKSCSTIYTRNKHNHAMKNGKNIRRKKKEEKKNPPLAANGQNYFQDRFGQLWLFHANVGKNISPDLFRSKFGFTHIQKNQKTINLHCQKANPAGGRCPFFGIYLKSNGCLYTRGQHEHTNRKKIPQNIGDDYMDHYGKIWKFNKEIGKNVKLGIFLNKFGFNKTTKNASGLNLYCDKRWPNAHCKFAGIYLQSNGCLYTRGKHNHAHIEKNPKPNVGDDYVDSQRKRWHFHAKIDKQHVPIEILRNKFGFTTIRETQITLNLYCQKTMTKEKRCQFAGIYVKENRCLYIRGKHIHKNNA